MMEIDLDKLSVGLGEQIPIARHRSIGITVETNSTEDQQ
jgi:hypothetical protein